MLPIGQDIPVKDGCDLPTMEELKLLIENRGMGLITGADNCWFLIKESDSHWVGVPGPEFGGLLYRGESKGYSETKPSLLRLSKEAKDNPEYGKLEYLVHAAKLAEFYSIIRHYPGLIELSQWKVASKTALIDYESQAQHYGLPTMLVDFSRSIDVAEFFARCRNLELPDSSWEMIPKDQFDGQLFTLDLAQILASPSSREELVFMGPSPFMRPYKQRAVGIYTEGQCIQKLPYVQCAKLKFSEIRALELLVKFDHGRALFPDDLMGKVAARIVKSKSITYQALLIASKKVNAPQFMGSLKRDFKKILGYTIEDRAPLLSESELNQFSQEWISISEEYMGGANLRWVSPIKILD